MNILITGCNGQLGNELKFIFDAGKSELGEIPAELKDSISVRYVDIDELDITDLTAVTGFISKGNFDVVINCAAYTNVDACEENLEAAMKVNAIGPRNLAIACEETGAKLVHVSTDYVFAGDGNRPYVEWDLTQPKSAYGYSKNLGEQYVRDFCSKYFIVRTAWLYGLIGKNFVKTMLNLAKTRDSITVVSDQRGNPTNAADLAYHIVKLIVTQEYGIYHCTCKGECSWYDFTEKIMEYAGFDNVKVNACSSLEYSKINPKAANRPAYSSLDNMMLRSTVGDDTRQWEEALKVYIQKLKERGEL